MSETAAGTTYQLEYTTSPVDSNDWTVLPFQFFGDGTEMTIFDSSGYATQKTYRIVGN